VELHIEQGPVLTRRDMPVGIVSGIRGTIRARDARVVGVHAHSGAVPREYRRDALLAAVEFAAALERRWGEWLAEGRDMVATFGKFSTDPAQASLTKVPGLVTFTLDIRSEEETLLDAAESFVRSQAAAIGERRGVTVDLGRIDRAAPALMTPALRARLKEQAGALGIPAIDIASGGGHDAANFAAAGIATVMIFVRNPNGSHHPDEDMAMADFAQAARLLTALLAG
jgi:N-carbamoyl-L-amino-acid hydrolase